MIKLNKKKYLHKYCDDSCFYHCTEGGQVNPKCVIDFFLERINFVIEWNRSKGINKESCNIVYRNVITQRL